MRRIAYPNCDCCGKPRPEYESEHWQLRVCYACMLGVANWFAAHELLYPNVLTQALFDGVFAGGTVPLENQYTVIHKSRNIGGAYSYRLLARVGK